jgi:hypothetical protein
MRWAGHVARMLRRELHIGYLWERGWVNNIKMDIREVEWDGMDWIHLA